MEQASWHRLRIQSIASAVRQPLHVRDSQVHSHRSARERRSRRRLGPLRYLELMASASTSKCKAVRERRTPRSIASRDMSTTGEGCLDEVGRRRAYRAEEYRSSCHAITPSASRFLRTEEWGSSIPPRESAWTDSCVMLALAEQRIVYIIQSEVNLAISGVQESTPS